MAKLALEVTECMQPKTLIAPLCCSFDIYGQNYVCYSYPNLDLSKIILRRGPYFKLIKNETARNAAQSLMALARLQRIKDFTDKVASQVMVFEDPDNPDRLFLSGHEKILEPKPLTDYALIKVFENDLLSQKFCPTSSLELSLKAKHHYKLRVKDYADIGTFLKLDIIARTLRDLILEAFAMKQSLEGGLMAQGIVRDVIRKQFSPCAAGGPVQHPDQLFERLKSKFPRVQMTKEETLTFITDNKELVEHYLLALIGARTTMGGGHYV